MGVDNDVEEDDMDFDPLIFLREGSPSETLSGLTSEAECEETSLRNQPSTEVPGNKNTGDSVPPLKRISDRGTCKENIPESTSTQLHCENGEGHVNGLGKEPLQTETSFSPSVLNSHPLLVEASKEDAVSRQTRARYSLTNYALEELETFLQESDDDRDLRNANAEEEYRKFLASILSDGGDDTQACQEDETQDEDAHDADFQLGTEEALENNGDKNAENYESRNGRNKKHVHRSQTRKKRPLLSKAVPSSSSKVNGAAVVEGFTDEQLGKLHMMIYEHAQLMIQTFSLSVLDPSKQSVAADVKKMIVELVGYREQALARSNTLHRQFFFERQHLQSVLHTFGESSQGLWIPLIRNPVMSILDVSPLHLALSYLSDVAASVVKHNKSIVDGTAEKTRSRKEPLFPSPGHSSGKDPNNVSQDRSNNVSTASPASPGQLHPKKTLAATLVDSTKKETVALVPFDIARLAQRFYPLFNCFLFPRKPPPAAMVQRVLFTDAEDGLLALGILEYNSDWDAIQKRFLPCKSTHQIFVRHKNRTSSSAPDNPVKEVRRMKTSPLSTEEIQRIEEGLKIFKNDWTSVWKFVLPHRDPAHLQRQWKVAIGVQRSYSKSDALKEKRRLYEAKRKKLKASRPDSRVDRGQEADDDASGGVENDDDSNDDDSNVNGTLDELQASQMGKEKGSHVVKLAPDFPPVNLPPSVRVMSQKEFHQKDAHINGTSDNADLFPVPPPTFTECVYTQLNLFPDRSTTDRSQQHEICNGNAIEDGAEQDFAMHPLLFQYPREVLSSYSHPSNLFPFEKSNNTINFHPLLQRTEVPEKDCHQFANQSDCRMREPPVLDQSTVRDIHLCSSTDFRNAKDFRSAISKPSNQPEGSIKDRVSISHLVPGNACSHHMHGIVMEQEELSDSEEDSQHVEFECEEIDDSEEEQFQDAEPCLTENKGTAKSVICSEFQERNDQCQIQQGLEQVARQGASLTHKSHGSSSTRSGRAKLQPEHAKRMGTRRSLRLSALRTST